jgi:heme-degrading monooxygenase HmoA
MRAQYRCSFGRNSPSNRSNSARVSDLPSDVFAINRPNSRFDRHPSYQRDVSGPAKDSALGKFISRRILCTLPIVIALWTRGIGAALGHRQWEHRMEITIRANNGIATLINIFTTEPGNQEKLFQLLRNGTDTLFSKLPGFIAASYHKSNDGRSVINYGQWRSAKDIEAFRSKPELGDYVKQLMALAKVESFVCEVAHVNHA